MRWLVLGFAAACGRVSFTPADASRGVGVGDGDVDDSSSSDSNGELGDAIGTSGACPAPIVTDSFDDGVLDATWTGAFDPDIIPSESGSHFVFTYGAPANSGSVTTLTSPVIDLRTRCVTVTVAQIRGASNSAMGIEVGTATARVRVQVVGDQLSAIDFPLSTIPPTVHFDPVAHARWRIQIGGGRVVAVALNSAGTPTQLLRDLPMFFEEANSQITLYSSVVSGNVSGGTAELDALEY